ncbi:MAG: hypothetical protein HON74_05870 [Flavobacteriaceae bacterium]|jgi:hypothetical protein|nr:hypothetical protein [Flavobacteriaceae bacterium]|tara:strand:+ start:523 stop:693 length:171 start_codon:yes stop_codon:yes gene_type:complete
MFYLGILGKKFNQEKNSNGQDECKEYFDASFIMYFMIFGIFSIGEDHQCHKSNNKK